jgi:hypothetical protein
VRFGIMFVAIVEGGVKEDWGDGLKVIKNFFASMYRHQFRAVIAATTKETTYYYIILFLSIHPSRHCVEVTFRE